jgi:hypothetical protein
MKKMIVLIFVYLLLFIGCNNDVLLEKHILNIIKKEGLNLENDYNIMNTFKNKKIIFLGEDHVTVNEQMFISEHIKELYDVGYRYFFKEGGPSLENYDPSSENYYFLMFYPWMFAGWRYETIQLYQSIDRLNSTLSEEERIKLICPEPDLLYIDEIMNDRDSYSASNIINIIENSDRENKAILLFGAAHARKKIIRNYIDTYNKKYNWIPLGYRLNKFYNSDFFSFLFYYPNNVELTNLLDKPRMILTENINKYIAADLVNNYDGIIISPEMTYGTFYQYNATNENLTFIFNLVENYALDNSIFISIDEYLPFDENGQFLMGIYYLKLYFKNNFDYSFWRTGSSKELLTALNELKEYAFAGNNPSDFIEINYDYNTMVMFHNYMAESNIDEDFNIQEDYLLKAYELFPEDIWSIYWLGFDAFEKRQYDKALGYFQMLLEDELVTCMEVLPLVYRKAAYCADMLNEIFLANEYTRIGNSLFNEFDLNVFKNFYTGYR